MPECGEKPFRPATVLVRHASSSSRRHPLNELRSPRPGGKPQGCPALEGDDQVRRRRFPQRVRHCRGTLSGYRPQRQLSPGRWYGNGRLESDERGAARLSAVGGPTVRIAIDRMRGAGRHRPGPHGGGGAAPARSEPTSQAAHDTRFGSSNVAVTSGQTRSGSPSPLLGPGPLRTGRATFTASGSSKPRWA